jgi:hypothetical protein
MSSKPAKPQPFLSIDLLRIRPRYLDAVKEGHLDIRIFELFGHRFATDLT